MFAFTSFAYALGQIADIKKEFDNALQSQSSKIENLTSDMEDALSNNENLANQYDDLRNDIDDIQNRVVIVMLISLPSDIVDNYEEPTNVNQNNDYADRYYGRLYIPDAQINVALYFGAEQEICDNQDSANIFVFSALDTYYIADHNTQEFGKLFNVQKGMKGYIELSIGGSLKIECTDVLSGHNTEKAIVDENGNNIFDADYLMYTCTDSW
jgi:sortase (surface protein transpeptidase)